MSKKKFNYIESGKGFWYQPYINYQGQIGRRYLDWPLIDIMSFLAEKKATILVEEVVLLTEDSNITAALADLDLTLILQNAIQQASMNGYAIIDIERLPDEGFVRQTMTVNPYPSVYDNWNIDNSTLEVTTIGFANVFSAQRYNTPNISILNKNAKGFNVNFTGGNGAGYLNYWAFSPTLLSNYSISYKFFSNPAFVGKLVPYENLYYKNERLYPHVDGVTKPFYLFQNKQFTLGYKNLIQNSDMWFLGNYGDNIMSQNERIFQEQETDISRVFGRFDSNYMNRLKNSPNDSKLVHSANVNSMGGSEKFATERAFAFTLSDENQVAQTATSFNGVAEIATLKEHIDVAAILSIGYKVFGDAVERETSATENIQRSISEKEKINLDTSFYKRQLKEALKRYLFFATGNYYDSEFDLKVVNHRGGITPSDVNMLQALYSSGLISLELAIRKANPDMNDKEVAEEIQRIKNDKMVQQEQEIAMNSLMNPEQTSLEENDNQNGVNE